MTVRPSSSEYTSYTTRAPPVPEGRPKEIPASRAVQTSSSAGVSAGSSVSAAAAVSTGSGVGVGVGVGVTTGVGEGDGAAWTVSTGGGETGADVAAGAPPHPARSSRPAHSRAGRTTRSGMGKTSFFLKYTVGRPAGQAREKEGGGDCQSGGFSI